MARKSPQEQPADIDPSTVIFRRPGKGSVVGGRRRIVGYVPLALAAKLADYCQDTGTSLTDVIEQAVERFLAEKSKK